MMKKIIVNYGDGNYWSENALNIIRARGGNFKTDDWRTDPIYIKVLEEFGSEFCSDTGSRLEVVFYDDLLYKPEFVPAWPGSNWETFQLVPSIDKKFAKSLTKNQLYEVLRDMNLIREE